MCVLLLVVPLFLSLPGLSQLIAALAFLTFTSLKKKKLSFSCLN